MPAKKAKATKPATSEKPRKGKKAPEVKTEPEVLAEKGNTTYDEQERSEYPEMAPVSDEAGLLPPKSKTGLLARYPDGSFREPTQAELVEMGRVLAAVLFPRPSDDAEKREANPNDPPPPKISGNHCRLCVSFAGNDQRGPLWSDSGHCLTYKHIQDPVEPEHCCGRFVFNEGLRG